MSGFDYLLLALLSISALRGFHRGLLAILGGLTSAFIALLGAFIYRNDLALYLEKEFHLKTILAQFIADKLSQPAMAGSSVGKFLPALNTIPLVQEKVAGLAQVLLAMVCFLLLFGIISKALMLIWKILQTPFRHSDFLGGIDHLAGLGLMVCKDFLIMAVVLGISYPFFKSGAGMGINGLIKVNGFIDHSQVAPYLFNVFTSLEKLLHLCV